MLQLKDDPWFDEQAVINRVKNLWLQLLTCRARWDLEPMQPYFSEKLYQKELKELAQDQAAMRMRYSGRPAVLEGTLTPVPTTADSDQEMLLCRLFTRLIPREMRRDTEAVIREGKESFFHEDWILCRPKGVKTPQPGAPFSVNCPNCGAPFSLYKSAKCPMCHSLISVPDFTWTVDQITVRRG